MLYHYTSAHGLLGILSSNALWATDAEFLNDAQELRFGRAAIRDALNATADGLAPAGDPADGPDQNRATILRSAASTLSVDHVATNTNHDAVHVACFCEDGDLLSQWRGYGSSGGFAVRFRTEMLANASVLGARLGPSGPTDHGVELVKVSYGQSAIQPVIDDVLGQIATEPTGFPGATGWALAGTMVAPTLASIKHPAFSEENEWRLIVATSDGLRFRTGGLGLIPYVELKFAGTAVSKIVVGPGEHAPLRTRAVQRLLVERGLNDVDIRVSEAPFRG